jgi:hypothetical protein
VVIGSGSQCLLSAEYGRRPPVDQARTVTANLFAFAATPDVVLVELQCDERLLPAGLAYGFGRVLISLGGAAGARY